MTKCPNMSKCRLLERLAVAEPRRAAETKRAYCQTCHSICARYLLDHELGQERTPADIQPGDLVRAMEIIERSPWRASGPLAQSGAHPN